eukprot:CAMPEP_0183360564 /NCGR_PEP_ID=MMETSP0164_2-20130417/55590_1 /TAXON_ID=221442 /ORGANISM="Coccolithus pelagicus ssp braarudi, Strain PLY182g" /LENGTH=89 /DNA_ID=CAMNT_0025534961 /DNA_START=213 /DNA_END=479 /DNA_ORIENTATION=+
MRSSCHEIPRASSWKICRNRTSRRSLVLCFASEPFSLAESAAHVDMHAIVLCETDCISLLPRTQRSAHATQPDETCRRMPGAHRTDRRN